MKKIFIALSIFSLCALNASSQKVLKSFPFNFSGTLKENYEDYKAGTPVRLCNFALLSKSDFNENTCLGVAIDSTQIVIPYSLLKYQKFF